MVDWGFGFGYHVLTYYGLRNTRSWLVRVGLCIFGGGALLFLFLGSYFGMYVS
jgi:hypothetical protein